MIQTREGNITIVDCDGHIESNKRGVNWADMLPEHLKPLAPFLSEKEYMGARRLILEGQMVPRANGPAPGRQSKTLRAAWQKHYETKGSKDGLTDPHARMPDMDMEGIDVSVLFGGIIGMHSSGMHNGELALALVHAYNDWAASYCGAYPDRLKAVCGVALQDPQGSAAEVNRALAGLGHVGICLPPNSKGVNLDNPRFFPVYEEANRLKAACCVHSGSGVPGIAYAGADRFEKFFFAHIFCHAFEQMIAFACITAGGLMERFPNVRWAFMEAGGGWFPYMTEKLEDHFETLGDTLSIKQSPKEYIESGNLFVSCEADESTLEYVAELMGDDKLLYASDYWHFDAKWPGTVDQILKREKLSFASKKKILGENALRLYNMKLGPKALSPKPVNWRGVREFAVATTTMGA